MSNYFVMPIKADVNFAPLFDFQEAMTPFCIADKNIITKTTSHGTIWCETEKKMALTTNIWLQSNVSETLLKRLFIQKINCALVFCSTYNPYSPVRLLASLLSSNRKEWLIALGLTKSHRVAQLLTLLSQPLTYKSCSDSCPCGGRGPTEGTHSAHSPADINSSQSSHSI